MPKAGPSGGNHYSCLVITRDTEGITLIDCRPHGYSRISSPPVDAAMHHYVPLSVSLPISFADHGYNKPGFRIGGHWAGAIEAEYGQSGGPDYYDIKPRSDGVRRCDSAIVKDIVGLDPSLVHDVITPDGEWHVVKDREHFRGLFLDPYPECRATIVDYNIDYGPYRPDDD